jgi:hypothetical protein
MESLSEESGITIKKIVSLIESTSEAGILNSKKMKLGERQRNITILLRDLLIQQIGRKL